MTRWVTVTDCLRLRILPGGRSAALLLTSRQGLLPVGRWPRRRRAPVRGVTSGVDRKCGLSRESGGALKSLLGQDGGRTHLRAEPGCHGLRRGPGREGQRASAVGAVPAGRPRGQHPHAQGQSHRPASRLRLRGVPERGGRRLRHQDHEHDQALREAHPGQQGLGPQQEPGRGRQHLHRQPGPGDRREAALRHLQRLRRHPADAQDHAGPGHGQLQGLRLHQLRQLRRLRRGHRGHERTVPLQPAHHRLLRLQEGLQGRAARLGGRAPAGGPEPPLAGGPAPPALCRRASPAVRAHPRRHHPGAGSHPARHPTAWIVPSTSAASRSHAPRNASVHAATSHAAWGWCPRPTHWRCSWRGPPSPSVPSRRDAPRDASDAGPPRDAWHGPAPPRTARGRRPAAPSTASGHAPPRASADGDASQGATLRIANGSPGSNAPPRDAGATSLDAASRIQRPPSATPLRLPADASSSPPCPETHGASSRAHAGAPPTLDKRAPQPSEAPSLLDDPLPLLHFLSLWTHIPVSAALMPQPLMWKTRGGPAPAAPSSLPCLSLLLSPSCLCRAELVLNFF